MLILSQLLDNIGYGDRFQIWLQLAIETSTKIGLK